MPKPNFYLIGAPKCATTNITVMLSRHPDICMVQGKEPHFFSDDRTYAMGFGWYESLYSHYRGESVVGDASTSYSRTGAFPRVVERIARYTPNARIVYSVRQPLERMASAYVEWMATPGAGADFTSVNDAVRRNPNIIDSSRYWKHLSAYRRHFRDEQIKIVWFEEYCANPQAVLGEVLTFLGVPPPHEVPSENAAILSRQSRIDSMRRAGNHSPIDTKWDRATRQWAINQLGDDTHQFLAWCGKPADYWRVDATD